MSELSAAVRFVNLAASLLLAGGFAFALLVARPATLSVAGASEADFSKLMPPRWRVAAACAFAVFASALLGFWLQLLYVGHPAGAPAASDAALTLLTQTQFGRVWLVRMALLVALVALIAWGSRTDRSGDAGFLAAGFVASALVLEGAALSGHASAAEGSSLAVAVSADMLHLLSCALWLGGLLPFTAMLRACRRDGGAVAAAVGAAAARRFSAVALASVPVLLATGGYNAWTFVNGFAPLFGTPYGELLLAKIGVMLPMLALGAMNFLALRSSARSPVPLDRIARNAAVETTLGVLIVMIVGHMGLLPPARHVQPDWPFALRWDWDAAAFTDAYPTTFQRPAVAYQAASVANGKRLYEASCAPCHGAGGYGDGPLAKDFHPTPPNLTAEHADAHTAGDLYWWISRGIAQTSMPGFEQKLGEEERWDVVNFLRALSGGDRARKLDAVVQDEPWLVAPDFAFRSVAGAEHSLRDYRGKRLVLLVLLGPGEGKDRLAQLAAEEMRLKLAGVDILAVPGAKDRQQTPASSPGFVLTEGTREIAESYALLARSPGDAGLLAGAPHVEFLIDKQGYVRARWLPAEGAAWDEIGNLLVQAERLNRETPRVPAPREHVH